MSAQVRGLYPLLSEGPLPLGDFAAAARALAPYVSVMQVRVKSLGDRARLALVKEVADVLQGWGGVLVVNDRADLAHILARETTLQVGLHLGQTDLPPRAARAIVGPDVIIGLSTHDLTQLAAASDEPVDYVAFGPVFQTTTKAHPDPLVGLAGLHAAAALTTRPLVAIGGLDPERARAACDAGASAVAVAGALFADGLAGLAERARRFV